MPTMRILLGAVVLSLISLADGFAPAAHGLLAKKAGYSIVSAHRPRARAAPALRMQGGAAKALIDRVEVCCRYVGHLEL